MKRLLAVSLLAAACAPRPQGQPTPASGLRIENQSSYDAKIFNGPQLLASLSSGENRTITLPQRDGEVVLEVRTLAGAARTQPERLTSGFWKLVISPGGNLWLSWQR